MDRKKKMIAQMLRKQATPSKQEIDEKGIHITINMNMSDIPKPKKEGSEA